MAPTLEVRGLATHFFTKAGVLKAVDDVSFTVPKGKVLGLVGESGSGKSVTGFSIIGLVDPPGRIAGGRILFQGQDLAGKSEEEMRAIRGNRIAMIFQDPMMTLNPVLRIDTQMIETVLAHAKVSREEARQRARDALGQVGIPSPDERLKSYPHQFSGGMRQRVAIAIALLHKPDLIIADEPVSALDVSIQAQILNLLMDLKDEFGFSYLFITHDLSVVRHISDRIGVMYLGFMVETGPTETIFSAPRHPYTKALLAAAPQLGTKRGQNNGLASEPLGGEVPSAIDLPKGCPFRQRCPLAMARCGEERPVLHPLGGGQSVACHLVEPAVAP